MRAARRPTWVVFLATPILMALMQLAADDLPNHQSKPPFDPAAHGLPASANDLARRVIENQLKHTVEPAYMFRIRKETPAGVQTKELIDTASGNVAWVVAINDKPLSEEQRKKEDDKLQNLLNSPDEQAKQFKRQKEDEERTRKMMAAMRDAFIYSYDGAEPPRNGNGELVRLAFKPNPDFNPPDRESQVFHGMEGNMLIDP